jgi:hypothetical protein
VSTLSRSAPFRTSTAPSRSASSGASGDPDPFGELLIDLEEDRTLRAVLVGMLREGERNA